jgi:hypothetical protein
MTSETESFRVRPREALPVEAVDDMLTLRDRT